MTDSSHDSLIVTRLESFCEKHDSIRVTVFLNVTLVESESPKIVTRSESLLESSYHWCHLPVTTLFTCGAIFKPPHCFKENIMYKI